MLANLTAQNVQQVAHSIIKKGFFTDSDFQLVAHQVSPLPVASRLLAAEALLLLDL